jgi:hypothetical protein
MLRALIHRCAAAASRRTSARPQCNSAVDRVGNAPYCYYWWGTQQLVRERRFYMRRVVVREAVAVALVAGSYLSGSDFLCIMAAPMLMIPLQLSALYALNRYLLLVALTVAATPDEKWHAIERHFARHSSWSGGHGFGEVKFWRQQ